MVILDIAIQYKLAKNIELGVSLPQRKGERKTDDINKKTRHASEPSQTDTDENTHTDLCVS
jgi:hypothetical protein